jgi:ApbE superfamily uncharacterized protein (UPF0280 family)
MLPLQRLETDPKAAFGAIKAIRGVEGALLIVGDKLATWGRLPTLVRAYVDAACVTHA